MLTLSHHRANLGGVVLGVILGLAQLFHGANDDLHHLWLDAAAALVLAVALAGARARGSLVGDPQVWMAGALFLVPMGVGAVSLAMGDSPLSAGAVSLLPGTLDRQATLLQLLHLGGLACSFLCARLVCRNVGGAEIFGRLLLIGFSVDSIVALVGYCAADGKDPGWRLLAGFSSPNSAATLMGEGVIWGAAVLFMSRRHARAAGLNLAFSLAWLSLLSCGLALLLTLSRGGIACILATMTGAALYLQTSGGSPKGPRTPAARRARSGGVRVPMRAVQVSLLMMLWVAAMLVGSILSQRANSLGTDWGSREVLYATHLQRWLARPLFGWGLGSFDMGNLASLRPSNFADLWSIRAAHNVALQWLVTGGAVSSLPMAGALALAIAAAWSGLRRGGQPWSAAIFFSAVFVLLHGMVDYALEEPSIAMLFSAMLGMGLALRPVTAYGRSAPAAANALGTI